MLTASGQDLFGKVTVRIVPSSSCSSAVTWFLINAVNTIFVFVFGTSHIFIVGAVITFIVGNTLFSKTDAQMVCRKIVEDRNKYLTSAWLGF